MKAAKKRAAPAKTVQAPARELPGWIYPAAIAACVLVFYWVPLTSSATSIQWDAADMHYPLQKYWSDHLRSGSLAFWTPYLFSGYPFLANPEVAAWYPPHWPFYLAGVTPWTMQAEIAVTALLACLGAYYFLAPLVGHRGAAFLGGLAYGLSGFFAGHASHIGLAAGAAWLPWLLAAYRRAMEGRTVRYAALGAAAGGCMLLAGYFQMALYGFLALGLYAIADTWSERRSPMHTAAVVVGMLAGAIGLAAVEILPALELTAHTGRALEHYTATTEGVLQAAPLATLVSPDALGAVSGNYRGPSDVTQYYWYGGLLLLPLAALGIGTSRLRIGALAMLAPALWYMAGPAGGIYRLGALVPGLHKVRAPIQGWFIVALALSMAAAGGAAWAFARWRHWAIPAALVAILFGDVWYWNSAANPLAYARNSFAELYGAREAMARRQIAATQPPLTRFDEPSNALALGPLDHALDLGLETTSGYFALSLRRMVEYTDAIGANPRLRAGANASRFVDLKTGTIESVPGTLPRAYFPKSVRAVADSHGALATLDPAVESILEGAQPGPQDAAATASVTGRSDRSYRIAYRAAAPSLLKLTESWFPGWRARAAGVELPIVRVDHAFMGVVVAAGAGEVEFEYRPRQFLAGVVLSLAAAATLALLTLRFPGTIR